MQTLNGAELTVLLLEQQGVELIAGIPGGAALPLYDALSQSRRIRHVLARHEQGAGFIAQGMARVTGRPAVCFATSGPGATNLVTAVADAKLDSIPLIAITGQVPSSLIGTDAFQEVDSFGLAVPITKHNFLVRHAAELAQVIPRAFAIATEGRPGPVWIDIPKDVQCERIEHEPDASPPVVRMQDDLDEAKLDRLATMIDSSRRPILYLGGGVVHSGAAADAVALAERASLPAVMTLMALGVLAPEHPLALGMIGMHGARYTNLALEECDLLIALGARFDDRATGKVSEFCPHARIVHVDIDPAEHGKIKVPDLAVTADIANVLAQLLPRVARSERTEWTNRIHALKQMHPLLLPGADNPRTHYGVIRATAQALDDEAIIVTDVGQHQMWVAQAYPLRRSRQWLTSGGLGTMGFGLPAAIGAALAAPGRTVVCFSGDGSLLMNVQELATAAEEQVNVKIVLLDNRSLGLVHQQQELFYGRRIFAACYRAPTDFVALARGFGIDAFDLGEAADARVALRHALREPGPRLIRVGIDVAEKVYPMVPPGAANRDMIGGLA